MPALLEADPDTTVFTTLVDANLTDDDAGHTGGWNSETRLHVLAWEIVKYMPALAGDLASAGRSRFMTVC